MPYTLKKSVGRYCSIRFLASDEKYGNPENEMKGWSSKRVTRWRDVSFLFFSPSSMYIGVQGRYLFFWFQCLLSIFRKNVYGPIKTA